MSDRDFRPSVRTGKDAENVPRVKRVHPNSPNRKAPTGTTYGFMPPARRDAGELPPARLPPPPKHHGFGMGPSRRRQPEPEPRRGGQSQSAAAAAAKKKYGSAPRDWHIKTVYKPPPPLSDLV